MSQPPTSAGHTVPGGGASGSAPSGGAGRISESADPARRAASTQPRETFDAFELAAVLSHYDIGVIESIRPFPRGSSRAPKVVIKCERGLFLLKRRAPGRDDPNRIAFSHALQLHLARRGFPLPRLVGDRRANNPLVRHDDRACELFEYLHGAPFDGSAAASRAAGHELAIFHRLTADFRHPWRPTAGGYHDATRILAHIDAAPDRIRSGAPPAPASSPDPGETATFLRSAYLDAAARAAAQNVAAWPDQVVHGDWHPGNVLFRDGAVAGVFDYDAARFEPRALDIANGALQFSMTMQGENPDDWPDSLDQGRFLAFCQGYDEVEGCVISTAEIAALPWLMIEALIVEAVIPIAATGSFATIEGGAFIRMVERKVRWLQDNADRLSALISG